MQCWTDRIPLLKKVTFLRIINGRYEEVDEPAQRILVHRLDVGQVSDRKKQNGRVNSNGGVAQACLIDLPLRGLGDGLFARYLIGQNFRRREDLNCHLIF